MQSDNAILLQTYPDVVAANMALDALLQEDIKATLVSDDAGGALPMMQVVRGVKLYVTADTEDAARAVLDAIEDAPPIEELPPSDPPSDSVGLQD